VYDFVIVGAGSAGCVLANRLSANPAHRVLLVEAGPRDWHPFIHMPAGLAKLVGKKSINWDYSTEPEPQLDNRRLWWPRGKVLGGSSSINAMCYIRGHRLDYDEWAAQGATGWSFDEVLPYFKRAQNAERGATPLHGVGGPLNVADLRYRNPLSQVFLDAAAERGLPANPDVNGAALEGFGWYQVTQKAGARCSAAAGYLHPALERANLTLITRAHARRVIIERGRAVGVELDHRGQRLRIEAAREVILAGGAINSPQLLMLSGVGPAAHLRAHGIDVQHASEGVGANLRDHLDACTLYRCTQPITYDRANELMVAWNYFVRREGMGTSNIAEAGGFARSPLAPDARPDLQFHFVPALLDDHGRNKMPGYGFTLHACALRPRSRGRIELASKDPAAKARIFANYLSDAEGFDLRTMVEGVKLSRAILRAPAFDAYRGDEIFPGAALADDAGIVKFIRARAETIYHPVGTCRMGSDRDAVVDPQLRVRGVDALRVVDASVMPTLIGGNTNAPTIMIAEKASELIAGAVVASARAEAVTV
jgi:choline dehydrogenase